MLDVLKHVYISPLERCNLCCKMCYTAKTESTLSQVQILDFLTRYRHVVDLETVTFCGGEVFLLPDFTSTVNQITKDNLIVQIITNGTIDRLAEMADPNLVNLIVSLDGLSDYHDRNRSHGMWQKSVRYLKTAAALGFHTEVFSIITQENLSEIGEFEHILETELGQSIPVTYHPRKPMNYLIHHPISNRVGETDGFSFLNPSERLKLGQTKKIFPPLELGCYQISVMSDGMVYGCCEGIRPLGKISDDISELLHQFEIRLENNLTNCIEPDFMCGLNNNTNESRHGGNG